jgi:hypothetical protein
VPIKGRKHFSEAGCFGVEHEAVWKVRIKCNVIFLLCLSARKAKSFV